MPALEGEGEGEVGAEWLEETTVEVNTSNPPVLPPAPAPAAALSLAVLPEEPLCWSGGAVEFVGEVTVDGVVLARAIVFTSPNLTRGEDTTSASGGGVDSAETHTPTKRIRGEMRAIVMVHNQYQKTPVTTHINTIISVMIFSGRQYIE